MVHPVNALTRCALAGLFFAGSIVSAGLCNACDAVCHDAEPPAACCAAAPHAAGTPDCSDECRCMLSSRDAVPSSLTPPRATSGGPDDDGIAASWLPLPRVADRAAPLLAAALAESRSPDRPVRVLYGVWRN